MKHKLKLYNKNVYLSPFEKKNVTKQYINMLNSNIINKYLNVRLKRQNNSTVEKYLNQFDNKNNFFWAIRKNKKSKLIGTITLRKKNIKASIGNMIGVKKYFGSIQSISAFQIIIDYAFNYLKIKTIAAGTFKENHSSNFNLINNDFKLIKENKEFFLFKLEKKNWKKKISYEKQ